MRFLILALLLPATSLSARGAEPLTIGSPAPKLELAQFVKGEPVRELAKGTTYVVEFSGTTCVPCIKCIPHLTEVQKKHKEVVVVSVYSEPADGVRKFVAAQGDKMGYRIAVDPDGRANRAWLGAAGVEGIPAAFVVDAKGAVAWIGHPAEMADPLAKILAGTFDPRADEVRLVFERARFAETTRHREPLKKGNEATNRVHKLRSEKKWAEALAAAEEAAREFPAKRFYFNCLKVTVLAANPATADEAVRFAAGLSAEAGAYWGDLVSRPAERDVEIGFALTLYGDHAASPRVADAALVLARRAEADLPAVADAAHRAEQEIMVVRLFAAAHTVRKEYGPAAERLRQALALVQNREYKPAPTDGPKAREVFERNKEAELRQIGVELAEVERAAGKTDRPSGGR